MVTPAINTIVKMLESLPEAAQENVAEHLRAYLAELQADQKWEHFFARTQYKLKDAALQARRQIADGKSKPMDFDQL
jgi:hypothetical protein